MTSAWAVGFKLAAGQFRAVRRRRRRHLCALDVGKVHPGLFEYGTVAEYATDAATAAAVALPFIADKILFTVFSSKCLTDRSL